MTQRMPVLDLVDGFQPLLLDGFEESLRGTLIEAVLDPNTHVFRYRNLEIPIPTMRRSDFRPVQAVVKSPEGVELTGELIHLPVSLTKALSYVQALEQGRQQNPDIFLRDYRRALCDELGKILEEHALRTRWAPGFQAHADTDLLLLPGEVGLSVKCAKKLARMLGVKPSELDGLSVLASRFPVAGAEGCRRVTLVTLPRASGKKIYFHPLDLRDIHGGDTDGDTVYLAVDEITRVATPRVLGEYPDPEVVTQVGLSVRSLLTKHIEFPDRETRNLVALTRSMNALIKQLTGILTWTFHALARGAAQYRKSRRLDYHSVYRATFTLFFPLIEAVMDAGKIKIDPKDPQYLVELEKSEARIRRFALALKGMMLGEALDKAAFEPFLQGAQDLALLEKLYRESDSLQRARLTVGGRLMTGGRKLGGSVKRIVGQMLDHGHAPDQMLREIQACVRMDRTWRLEPSDSSPQDPVRWEPTSHQHHEDWVSALESITWRGTHPPTPVFQNVRLGEENGYTVLTFDLFPFWIKNPDRCWPGLKFYVPEVAQLGNYGHCRLWMPGELIRVYRPVIGMSQKAGAQLEGVYDTFRRLVKDEMLGWQQRRMTKENVQRALLRIVLRWLHKLPVSGMNDCEDPTLCDVIERTEFAVHMPGIMPGRDVIQVWDETKALMREVLDGKLGLEFDLQATSKGQPLSIITLADSEGKAVYGDYLNPFYRYLEPKRRAEVREITRALPLIAPSGPSVQLGDKAFPEAYRECVTEVWTAFVNLNYGVFPDKDGKPFTFDTLLATPGTLELLQVREERFDCQSLEELNETIERLKGIGIEESRLSYEEVEEMAGYLAIGPVYKKRYRLWVEGGQNDEGKVKALVGPMKGILTMLPYRVVAVMPDGGYQDIHLIWPEDSADNKLAADAGCYMGSAKGGLTRIDPSWTKKQLATKIEGKLKKAGFDPSGRQQLLAIHPNGDVIPLGEFLCGPLPVFRAPQTENRTAKWRSGSDGVKFEPHSMLLANVPHRWLPEVNEQFTDLLETLFALPQDETVEGEEFGYSGEGE